MPSLRSAVRTRRIRSIGLKLVLLSAVLLAVGFGLFIGLLPSREIALDRNADGDVSAREFLGTPEQFKQLDEDGDGYISLEEALRAESRLRQKTGAKR